MSHEPQEDYAPRIEGGRFVVSSEVNRVRHEMHFDTLPVKCFVERSSRFDDLLRDAQVRAPDVQALLCGEDSVTYREFGAWADRIAFGLSAAGIGQGDRVGVFIGNGLPFFLTVMGIVRAGAIAVPMSAKMSASEVAYVLEHCAAAGLVWEKSLQDRMPVISAITTLCHEWCVDSVAGELGNLEELFPEAHEVFPTVGSDDDTILLFYTSGTTGRPKGACITNLNIVHSALQYAYAIDLKQGQRGLLAIPGSHISGFMALFTNMLTGCGTTVILREYHTDTVIQMMEKERITFTVFVPTIYHLILMHSDFHPERLSCWRVGIYGGGIMAPSTVTKMGDIMPQLRLINAYGATETASPVSIMPAWASVDRPSSVGLLVQCAEALVMDDDGHEVPCGAVGELWVRGPMVIPGYWNDPEQTAQSFKAGFWKTGDMVNMDADGFLYIHDRKKDMINRGGYKVFSAEVENVALSIDGVMEAAAVAVNDAVMGERVCLFLRVDTTVPDEAKIRSALARELSDYKQPDFYCISDQPLPRNANGKLVKAPLTKIAKQFEGCRPNA